MLLIRGDADEGNANVRGILTLIDAQIEAGQETKSQRTGSVSEVVNRYKDYLFRNVDRSIGDAITSSNGKAKFTIEDLSKIYAKLITIPDLKAADSLSCKIVANCMAEAAVRDTVMKEGTFFLMEIHLKALGC